MSNFEQDLIDKHNVGKNVLSKSHIFYFLFIVLAIGKIFHANENEYVEKIFNVIQITQELTIFMLFIYIFTGIFKKKEYYVNMINMSMGKDMFKSKMEFSFTSKSAIFEILTYVLMFISGDIKTAIAFLIFHTVVSYYYWKNYDFMREIFVKNLMEADNK